MKFYAQTDKNSKKMSKSFPIGRYSEEECKYLGKLWMDWVHDGCNGDFQTPTMAELKKEMKAHKESTVQKPVANDRIIEEFDITKLEPPLENGGISFLCLGSTRSGKSYAMNWLYEKFFKKHITILMTLSKQAEIYKALKKTAIVTDGFHPQFVEEAMRINRFTNNKYNFCLIFDDLAMEGKTDVHMTKLLTIGRNSGMNAILCGQKMTMLSATGRTNCNYIFLFYQNTESAIEYTIKTFLRCYFPRGMSMVDMIAMYKEQTADHHFYFVDTLLDKCYLCKI